MRQAVGGNRATGGVPEWPRGTSGSRGLQSRGAGAWQTWGPSECGSLRGCTVAHSGSWPCPHQPPVARPHSRTHDRHEKSRCAWIRAPLSWQTRMGIRIAEFLRFGISLSPAYFLRLPSCYHQFSLLDSPRDDKGLAGKQSKLSKAIKKTKGDCAGS